MDRLGSHKRMIVIGLAVLFSLGALGAIIALNVDTATMIAAGGGHFRDNAGRFAVNGWSRLFAVALIAATITSPVLLAVTMTKVESNFVQAEKVAVERKANLDELTSKLVSGLRDVVATARKAFNQTDKRYRDALLEGRLRALESSQSDVAAILLRGGELAIRGQRDRGIGDLPGHSAEIRLVDSETIEDRLIVVVHLLDGLAYWDFMESNLFVKSDDRTDINLWRSLSTVGVVEELEKYDYVAGLGLQSKTRILDDDLSENRAKFLCAGLESLLKRTESTQALGLDVGVYKGAVSETAERRDPKLRPVVFIGIDVKDDAVDYKQFTDELLANVKISGVDLGMFEYLSDGRHAKWILPPECASQHAFIQPPL